MRFLRALFAVAVTVAVVSAALLVFVLITHGRDEENVVAALPPPTLSTADDAGGGAAVLLLRAEATARHFASVSGADPEAYDRRIEAWRRRIETAGGRVRVVDETALATALAPAAVVVAPSAAALHDDTVARLAAAVERGAGLVATWTYGVYGADGAWRGYAPLGALVGARVLADADGGAAPRYLALHGQTSVTAGIPAGARVEIQPYDRPLPLTSDTAVGEFVDWSMLARDAGAGPPQTAVARAVRGRGRVVWLNFEPEAVVGGGAGTARVDRLVANALAWAGGRPLGDLETWPRGARAAAAIGLDAEHEFAAGTPIAARLAASNVPFTSFVLSKVAGDHPDTLRALAAASEIASHTHDHRPLSEQDEDQQRAQLVESREILRERTGRTVIGLRPPEEQTNGDTLAALAATGYHWVVGWRDKDRAEPWMLESGGKAVVVLPRIPHDDFEYVVRRDGADVAGAWTAMRSDLQQVRRFGGFYFFDFHTQFWNAPAIRGGVRHLTGLRNLPGVWLATVGEVAAWWRVRSRAATRVVAAGEGAVTVELASGAAASELAVVVYLADVSAAWSVEAVRGAPPAVASLGGADGRLRLVFRDLAAGERRLVRLVRG
ncbi:MAG: polysaccharide deacetylase family protein [Deltaproteobacteria bacterium]|nr:polysaccharide deacetylase family protein [Deltaproteobacteria bacterium]